VHPFDLGTKRRWWAKEKLRCHGDTQENKVSSSPEFCGREVPWEYPSAWVRPNIKKWQESNHLLKIHDLLHFSFVFVSIWFSRVIWLGDLNYRIALSYRSAKALVEMQNWRALLENDQLRIEQKRGHVFKGWNEGKIYFPPTYKYSNNSDRYAGGDLHPKEKRRTPAW
jgi:hypothetical protein